MNKELKIAHLTCVYPPYQGGIGSVAQKYAQIGVNNNYEVSVCTPNYQKIGHIEEEDNNVMIHRFSPLFSLGNAGYINIKKHLKKIDILHIHYPFYASVISAILNSRKKKIVLSWHMNPNAQGIKGLIFKLYELIFAPWIFKQVDQIIVSTKDYFQDHSLFKKFEDKIVELSFSVNVNKFKANEKNLELVKEYELADKKVLMFVGGLDKAHYFKGVNILLKAFQKLSSEHLLMIIGEGELKEDYKRQAEKLKIDDRVIFTGGIKNKDLVKHYNLGDCLILPSINQGEAFGIVQIEAMACGKPVIVSSLPGVRTVLKNDKTGFTFENQNVNDLVDKINQLFSNPNQYQKFCQNARNRVIEKYSDQVISKKLINIYENLFN
jgi:glycosyltransferase involved in cell wall biosynthesis